MPTTTKKITSVLYYNCGNCVNRLGFVYRNQSFRKRVFPSGVFLIKHPKHGYVLFDTGYSLNIYKTGWRGWLYRLLNPTHVSREEEIDVQLKKDGITPKDIQYVVLSHLHPDHIGGLKFFNHSQFIITKDSYRTYQHPHTTDLLFPALLPKWFESHILKLEDMQLKLATHNGLAGYDLFGDGTLILTPLEGHTHGHLGVFIPGELLLAGDACWGEDLMKPSRNMRRIINLIHHDHGAFLKTLQTLSRLKQQGVRLCFSHDQYEQKELMRAK